MWEDNIKTGIIKLQRKYRVKATTLLKYSERGEKKKRVENEVTWDVTSRQLVKSWPRFGNTAQLQNVSNIHQSTYAYSPLHPNFHDPSHVVVSCLGRSVVGPDSIPGPVVCDF